MRSEPPIHDEQREPDPPHSATPVSGAPTGSVDARENRERDGALTTDNHDRDAANLRYVYPVVSRRAKGVSIGINLNPNNACNWACVYCQVPDLKRGAAPAIDRVLLRQELKGFLSAVTQPEWLERNAPPEARRINDLAFSGNGEPTTAIDFDALVGDVLKVRADFGLDVKTVLITNGSQVHKEHVRRGLEALRSARGEVWFKIDCIGRNARETINGTNVDDSTIARNLRTSASACPTYVQTCMFGRDGVPPSPEALEAYTAFLSEQRESGTALDGVLLYGLARPSLQPEAGRLSRLEADWMTGFASLIESRTGLSVSVHP